MGVTINIVLFDGPPVTLPDNNSILPVKRCNIHLGSAFSDKAITATNLPHLKSSLLMIVGPICGDNKLVIFDKKIVQVVTPNPALKK